MGYDGDSGPELVRLRLELRRAREKAENVSRDRTRFLAAASHDLLQPLNAARLYASSMIEQARDPTLQHLAQRIEASLNAVEELMTAVLDISRLESGVVAKEIVPFPIGAMLDKALVEFTPLSREHSVPLRIVPSSHWVLSDRIMVGRIVQNLVSNAIKYTPAGGHVLVGVRQRGNLIRLDVVDTGIGVADGQQALIFEEFTRLEAGAQVARGLGLGLSIVRRLVAALGVRLDLASVPGRGSRFSLLLSKAPPGESPGPDLHQNRDSFERFRVLCIDNEPDVLEGMRSMLSGWGCEVRVATSLRALTEEALLSLWVPDAILMDFHLHQASGLDSIEWLHQTVGAHVPAALITADRSEGVHKLARARGIPVLHKPIRPARLRALLSAMQRGEPYGASSSGSEAV